MNIPVELIHRFNTRARAMLCFALVGSIIFTSVPAQAFQPPGAGYPRRPAPGVFNEQAIISRLTSFLDYFSGRPHLLLMNANQIRQIDSDKSHPDSQTVLGSGNFIPTHEYNQTLKWVKEFLIKPVTECLIVFIIPSLIIPQFFNWTGMYEPLSFNLRWMAIYAVLSLIIIPAASLDQITKKLTELNEQMSFSRGVVLILVYSQMLKYGTHWQAAGITTLAVIFMTLLLNSFALTGRVFPDFMKRFLSHGRFATDAPTDGSDASVPPLVPVELWPPYIPSNIQNVLSLEDEVLESTTKAIIGVASIRKRHDIVQTLITVVLTDDDMRKTITALKAVDLFVRADPSVHQASSKADFENCEAWLNSLPDEQFHQVIRCVTGSRGAIRFKKLIKKNRTLITESPVLRELFLHMHELYLSRSFNNKPITSAKPFFNLNIRLMIALLSQDGNEQWPVKQFLHNQRYDHLDPRIADMRLLNSIADKYKSLDRFLQHIHMNQNQIPPKLDFMELSMLSTFARNVAQGKVPPELMDADILQAATNLFDVNKIALVLLTAMVTATQSRSTDGVLLEKEFLIRLITSVPSNRAFELVCRMLFSFDTSTGALQAHNIVNPGNASDFKDFISTILEMPAIDRSTLLRDLERHRADYPDFPWNWPYLTEQLRRDPGFTVLLLNILFTLHAQGLLVPENHAKIFELVSHIQKQDAVKLESGASIRENVSTSLLSFLTSLGSSSLEDPTTAGERLNLALQITRDFSGDGIAQACILMNNFHVLGVLKPVSLPDVMQMLTAIRLSRCAHLFDDIMDLLATQATNHLAAIQNGDHSWVMILKPDLLAAVAQDPSMHNMQSLAVQALSSYRNNIGRDMTPDMIQELVEAVGWVARRNGKSSIHAFLSEAADYASKSPLHAAADYLRENAQAGETADPLELASHFVPPAFRNDFFQGSRRVTRDQYNQEPYSAYLYGEFRASSPVFNDLTYDEFTGILQDIESSTHRYAPAVRRFLERHGLRDRTALTSEEQEAVLALSDTLHFKVLESLDPGNNAAITFRDLTRFNEDFSRYYLRYGGSENADSIKKTLEIFIVTAHNVYGRAIRDLHDKELFVDILRECFADPEHRLLFGQLQSVDSGYRTKPRERIRALMDYADYEDLSRSPQKKEVPLKVSIRATINRSFQVARPLLLKVDEDNSFFVEEVLHDMGREPDTETIFLTMNHFTRRKELFGMTAPTDKDGGSDDGSDDVEWRDGILVKLARQARLHPRKKFVLVFENIEACPGKLRFELNSVLWEKTAEIPEKGERLLIPPNLHMVFTMHKDAEIKDDAFMNRPLVQMVDPLNLTSDLPQALSAAGYPEDLIRALHQLMLFLKGTTWEGNVQFNWLDILEMAKRIKGHATEYHRTWKMPSGEIYDYLTLRLHTEKDRNTLWKYLRTAKLVSESDRNISIEFTLDRHLGEINFDGVKLKASSDFLAFAAGHPGMSMETLILHYGTQCLDVPFVTTELERRIFGQLARGLKYGSNVIQLEGPSGEGKTEIGRMFAALIGFQVNEKTINGETDLSNFRGRLRPTRSGNHELYEPPYLTQITEGGHMFLDNEINTSRDNALYFWQFPEIAHQSVKYLTEFASSDDSIAKMARINQNNLWLFTVNPDNMKGRNPSPPRIAAHVVRFNVAQDPKDLLPTIQGIFKGKELSAYLDYAASLHKIHVDILDTIKAGEIISPQVVTRREIIRCTDLFKSYLSDGYTPERAFKHALYDTYGFMWKERSDIRKVDEILRHALLKITSVEDVRIQDVLHSALRSRKPVLILHNAANSMESMMKWVRGNDPRAIVHEVPLSYFHNKRQFLGGNIPSRRSALAGSPLQIGLGILANLIKEARLEPDRDHVAVFQNYTHLNPKIAPLLNEFWQKGRLDGMGDMIGQDEADDLFRELQEKDPSLWQRLRTEYGRPLSDSSAACPPSQRLLFAQWFYSTAPSNFRTIVTGSSEEHITLAEAEINRFLTVNISEEIDPVAYMARTMPAELAPHRLTIETCIAKAFGLYKKQMEDHAYKHNRLGYADIDIFLKELSSQAALDQADIERIAYYTLGIGLRPAYRDQLSYWRRTIPEHPIRYETRNGAIYLIVDGIEIKTQLKKLPHEDEFLAPTQNLLQPLAAILLAVKYGRPVISEGFPGGGKTSSYEELARRLGVPFYKIQMYEDIDPGVFLGRLSKRGSEYHLTCDKVQGHYVMEFLKAYSEGGICLLDEGAIGANSQEVISYLHELALQNTIDLGTYHPGLQGEVIRRHPDFLLAVAQNPANSTRAREPIPYKPDTESQKIWVDNAVSPQDARLIIDFYLKERQADLDPATKAALANLHIQMCAVHPQKEELSPRQLITVTRMVKKALDEGKDVDRALFQGIMMSYLIGLTDKEFKALWPVVHAVFENRFDGLLKEWNDPVSIRSAGTTLQFDGIILPASQGTSNVPAQDIRFPEDLPSQNRALREIATKFSLHRPVALLEEDGADALDLIQKFALKTGYALEVLTSHPQMTRMHLLSSVLPRFEPVMDKYGVRREDASETFVLALGFIAQSLVHEKDLGNPALNRHPKILFCDFMDAIPERQRVVLNELLTTSRFTLQDDVGRPQTYVLPDWVHFVISSPEEHKFSSAFINRFDRPIRVKAFAGEELAELIKNRCPLVSDMEIQLADALSHHVYERDRDQGFGLQYGFSPRDALKLALLIQMEKQKDIESGHFQTHPLYYFMKATVLQYLLAVEEGDRLKIEEEALPVLVSALMHSQGDMSSIYLNLFELKRAIFDQLAEKHTEPSVVRVQTQELSVGGSTTLDNQFKILKTEEGYILETPGNLYELKDAETVNWKRLSSGLRVKRENGQLLIETDLLSQLGGMDFPRSDFNRRSALPEEEVSTPEFVRVTPEIGRMYSTALRFWRPFRDFQGRLYLPRVIFLNGATGSAKTMGVKNLCRQWGVPLYTLNAYQDLKVSDAMMGMKMRDGGFEIGIREFLARCGTIDGKRVAIPSKTTSSRNVLMIDEANASPQLLYALKGLLRGDKKFTFHYAGESHEIELDSEVMVILTFNPAELYAARDSFARELVSWGEKIWAPNPQKYDRKTRLSILSEYHRRGFTQRMHRLAEQMSAVSIASRELFVETEPIAFIARHLVHPAVDTLSKVIRRAESALLPDPSRKSRRIVVIDYDLEHIRQAAEAFQSEEGATAFVENVLNEFMAALACRQSAEVLDPVLAAARRLDPSGTIAQTLLNLHTLYSSSTISKMALKKELQDLRRTLIRNHRTVVFIQIMTRKNVPYLIFHPEPVLNETLFSAQDFARLGLSPVLYSDGDVRAVHVEGNRYPEAGMLGFFEGEYAFVLNGRHRRLESTEMQISWTAQHETGHVIDQLRYRKEGIPAPRNIELNAMLFPMIFSPYAKEYIRRELFARVEFIKDKHDYYCQAAKGILNGILIASGQQDLFTDAFEEAPLRALKTLLDNPAIDVQRIQALGVMFYTDPVTYLATAKAGRYRRRAGTGGQGAGIENFMAGLDFPPDVEWEYEDGEELDIEVPHETEHQPSLVNDEKQERHTSSAPESGGMGEDLSHRVASTIRTLHELSPELVTEFLDVFAGDSKEITDYSDEGEDIDFERYAESKRSGDMDLFKSVHTVREQGTVDVGITVDISGSTHGHLLPKFVRMARFYCSLFYHAAAKNKKVNFSLNAIGEQFHTLLKFADCRVKAKSENSLGLLTEIQDNGGIDTHAVIEGLRKNYAGRLSQPNKIEFVFTDGQDTSGKTFDELNQELEALAKDTGVRVVFVGVGPSAIEVRNYKHFILLKKEPEVKDLILLIMQVCLMIVRTQGLPEPESGMKSVNLGPLVLPPESLYTEPAPAGAGAPLSLADAFMRWLELKAAQKSVFVRGTGGGPWTFVFPWMRFTKAIAFTRRWILNLGIMPVFETWFFWIKIPFWLHQHTVLSPVAIFVMVAFLFVDLHLAMDVLFYKARQEKNIRKQVFRNIFWTILFTIPFLLFSLNIHLLGMDQHMIFLLVASLHYLHNIGIEYRKYPDAAAPPSDPPIQWTVPEIAAMVFMILLPLLTLQTWADPLNSLAVYVAPDTMGRLAEHRGRTGELLESEFARQFPAKTLHPAFLSGQAKSHKKELGQMLYELSIHDPESVQSALGDIQSWSKDPDVLAVLDEFWENVTPKSDSIVEFQHSCRYLLEAIFTIPESERNAVIQNYTRNATAKVPGIVPGLLEIMARQYPIASQSSILMAAQTDNQEIKTKALDLFGTLGIALVRKDRDQAVGDLNVMREILSQVSESDLPGNSQGEQLTRIAQIDFLRSYSQLMRGSPLPPAQEAALQSELISALTDRRPKSAQALSASFLVDLLNGLNNSADLELFSGSDQLSLRGAFIEALWSETYTNKDLPYVLLGELSQAKRISIGKARLMDLAGVESVSKDDKNVDPAAHLSETVKYMYSHLPIADADRILLESYRDFYSRHPDGDVHSAHQRLYGLMVMNGIQLRSSAHPELRKPQLSGYWPDSPYADGGSIARAVHEYVETEFPSIDMKYPLHLPEEADIRELHKRLTGLTPQDFVLFYQELANLDISPNHPTMRYFASMRCGAQTMDEEYSRFLKTVLTDDPAGWKSIVNLDTLYTDPGETLYRLGKFDLTAAGMPVEIGYLDALPHDVAVRHAGAWLSKVISDDAAGYNEHHPGNLDLYFTQSRENFEVLLDRFGADSTKQLLAIARPLVLNDLKGDYPNRYVGAKSELDSLDMELATYQRKYRSPTPLRNLGTLNASARITRFAKGHLLSIFLILSSLIWSLKYSRRVFYRKRTRHRRDNTSGAS